MTTAPSRAWVATDSTTPAAETLRTPVIVVTFASSARPLTQDLTFLASSDGAPSTPSVRGIVTHEALVLRDARCSSLPSETTTLRSTMALAWSATFCAAAVVTVGTTSTYFTVAVVEVRVLAAVAAASWRPATSTVLPTAAGVTTKDFLSPASATPASLPFAPAVATSSAARRSPAAVSVRSTGRRWRDETSDVA